MADTIPIRIVAVREETALSKTFTLASAHPLEYQAGQFLSFVFRRGGKEIRRSYSFSSSPDADREMAITIKRNPNGAISRWWIDEAEVGDELEALLPAGVFTIDWQEEPRDLFFVAAGSGITPLYSLIKSALIMEPQSRIVLIYANSSSTATIFLDELGKMQEQFADRLKIEWLFSTNQNLLRARLNHLSLQDMLEQHQRPNKAQTLIYTCGPYEFMRMVEITVLSMGYDKGQFRKELFDEIRVDDSQRRYYDDQDRQVTLYYRGKSHSIPVRHDQAILDAALAAGITIPYSCRAGRCSACKCRVLHGKVWMHYNEVLTDRDEAKGLALTCTGHPMTDDLVIEVE